MKTKEYYIVIQNLVVYKSEHWFIPPPEFMNLEKKCKNKCVSVCVCSWGPSLSMENEVFLTKKTKYDSAYELRHLK